MTIVPRGEGARSIAGAAFERRRRTFEPPIRACPATATRLTSVIAPNVLDRQFTATRPNQRWIADFTYVSTAEGWLYVAAAIDLFSRRVVGWSMKAEMTAGLVTDARRRRSVGTS